MIPLALLFDTLRMIRFSIFRSRESLVQRSLMKVVAGGEDRQVRSNESRVELMMMEVQTVVDEF